MLSKEVKIVAAETEDAAAISAIELAEKRATNPNEEFGISRENIEIRLSRFTSDEWVKEIEKQIKDPNKKVWVAWVDDRIVGFSIAAKHNDHNDLASAYVSSGYQSMGIGKSLIKEVLTWLGTEKDITVDVLTHNKRAIAVYEKFGFKFDHDFEDSRAAGLGINPLHITQLRKPRYAK